MSIEQQAIDFDNANPWVFDELVKLARDLKRRGHTKLGIGMLFEVVRWQYMRSTADPSSAFKLNNNYRSRYARWIMDENEDLAGIFDVRELTTS